jgi:aromatic-L-amino-acid decarboxylase
MTPDEFRLHGHEMVEWVARYMETVEQYPVLSRSKPGQTRQQLPEHAPEDGESFASILQDLERVILPGVTHWQSPNFFGFFPANNSGPSILGELAAAGLGVQGMLWATSPACTELETHLLDWLVEMLTLPDQFRSSSAGGGVIQDTASSATLCALLAARERASNGRGNRQGLPDKMTCYASNQAHSSVEKAVMISGIGTDNLRLIDVDSEFRMRPDALRQAIDRDLHEGCLPTFVCATVGTTSSLAMDPIAEIGEICRAENIWLHVDAAMAGTAALCDELRWIHEGLELADSYCFNPHKWMFTNFDCDCFYVADRAALLRALSILPEYLRNEASQSGKVIDYRDWQVPLGRRFRALKLWFVIRWFGVSGLRQKVREHVALAQEMASWIEASADLELAAPVHMNLICFRHRNGEEASQQLLERLNQSGELFLTHTRLNDLFTLRMAIGQTETKRRHVERAWNKIQEAAQRR